MKQHTFTLHDDSVNTYGYRMLTSGANLEEFRKNPVMFYAHDDVSLPIGRWENIRIDGSRILADAVFDEDDAEAVKIMKKVESNFIRMASIGAWAPDEASDDAALKLDGQTGPTVTRWTVREASIVPIGANHNALVMYDRKTGRRINLADASALMQFMDKPTPKINNNMKHIKEILKLQDNATEEEVTGAIEALQAEKALLQTENAALQTENAELKETAAEHEKQQAEALKAEAVKLVDAAVKQGRISATCKDAYLNLFDKDFAAAKQVLAAIPARRSITQQIEQRRSDATAKLADLGAMSWDELDRANKLVELRDNDPEMFREKFKERFGVEPSII